MGSQGRENCLILAWFLASMLQAWPSSRSNSPSRSRFELKFSQGSWLLEPHCRKSNALEEMAQPLGESPSSSIHQPWSFNNKTIQEKKNKITRGKDILRWGHKQIGAFTVKEAYTIHAGHNHQHEKEKWKRLWHSNLWPKVTLLLWKVHHRSILNWVNLTKKGFQGPSLCSLCQQEAESMQHILINCPFSVTLWDSGTLKFRQSDLNRASIHTTLQNWHSHPFKNPILNRILQLLSGFITWNIWKERNNRIFNDHPSSTEATWIKVHSQIQDTLNLSLWFIEDM